MSREAVSPLARTEHVLLPWVNLLALPLFALANAGVHLSADAFSAGVERRLIVAMLFARIVGKGVGIDAACACSWSGSAWGGCPPSVTPRVLIGAALAAAAPFTVSLFVADAAFPEGSPLLDAARAAVLVTAIVSAAAAIVVLRTGTSCG